MMARRKRHERDWHQQPTWVYRLRCEHGAVIYTGIAFHLEDRLSQHRATKTWWPEVASVEAHQFPTRDAARAAEISSITLDSPVYNIADVDDNGRFEAQQWTRTHSVWKLPRRIIWYRDGVEH